jgi:serine/threonine protein kinase
MENLWEISNHDAKGDVVGWTDVWWCSLGLGQQMGVYKLVRRVGQGGVFLAERTDGEFLQQVAIKLVPPGSDSNEVLSRFRTERQTLAGLDHPNIVKLLDGGSTPGGLPYLVMDSAEGSAIDQG